MNFNKNISLSLKIIITGFLFLCCILPAIYAQPTKEFYNSEWQKTDSAYAQFYRVIQYDASNKPEGQVKDFHITGELQWEGYLSYTDPIDKSKDKIEGLCAGYYKNGTKRYQGYYVNNKRHGVFKSWFEGGASRGQYSYFNDTLNGLSIEWYETGLLAGYAFFKNGTLDKATSVYCNEYGDCIESWVQKFPVAPKTGNYYSSTDYGGREYQFFSEEEQSEYNYSAGKYGFPGFHQYSTGNDLDEWPIIKNKQFSAALNVSGYQLKNKGKTAYKNLIAHPLDYEKNFRITARISFINAKDTTKQSLIFAYRDDRNFYRLSVTKSGEWTVGGVKNGEAFEIYRSRTSEQLNQYQQSRSSIKNMTISIERFQDSIKFSLGSKNYTKIKAPEMEGPSIGVEVAPGSEMILVKLSVTVEIKAPFVSPEIDIKSASKGLWKGTGSGFVISTDGYIITNHHVIDKAKQVEVDIVKDGEKISYAAEIILTDKVNDLALIKIKDDAFTGFDSIPYTIKTDLADVGTQVFALGYPLAFSQLSDELKFTEGTINSRTGREGMITAYQVSTPVQPGNSGGPLFDYEGNLLGVINEKILYADNVAFAIKSNYITNLIALLPKPLQLPANNFLRGKEATEQVKIIREFIPLVKVR